MPDRETSATQSRYLPPLGDDELARRSRAAIRLLDVWDSEGDDQDQRETMAVLRRALGEARSIADRKLFP